LGAGSGRGEEGKEGVEVRVKRGGGEREIECGWNEGRGENGLG